MPKPTIVIENLSALQGGGETYLLNLFQNIPSGFAEKFRVVAIIPQGIKQRISGNTAIELVSPEFPQRGLWQRLAWQWLELPRLIHDLGTNVFYCPGGILSASRNDFKTVVAFRNMLPFANHEQWNYPLGYQRFRNYLLRIVQSRSFKRADAVIFLSEFARDVINAELPDRKGFDTVIHHGIGDGFRQTHASPLSLTSGYEYCLYVSTLDYYKAQLEVVHAWNALRKKRPTAEKLILVGPENRAYRKSLDALTERLGLRDEVIVPGPVPYADLPALMQHAKINIFASACENCPNTLLEAMASGRPILSSDKEPMPEFAGSTARYFDPFSPDELTALLLEVIDDPAGQQEMGTAAEARSKEFDWRRSAGETWAQLESLAERGVK